MHRTRFLAFAAVVTLALAPLAACGGSDDSAASSTTATDGEQIDQNDGTTQGDSTEATTIPTSTVPDDEFTELTDQVNDQLKDAGSDPCKLLGVLMQSLPQPNGPAQVEQAGQIFVSLFNTLADVDQPGNEANAQILKDTATKIEQTGASDGWSLETLQAIFSEPDVQEALASYGQNCSNLGGTPPPPTP